MFINWSGYSIQNPHSSAQGVDPIWIGDALNTGYRFIREWRRILTASPGRPNDTIFRLTCRWVRYSINGFQESSHGATPLACLESLRLCFLTAGTKNSGIWYGREQYIETIRAFPRASNQVGISFSPVSIVLTTNFVMLTHCGIPVPDQLEILMARDIYGCCEMAWLLGKSQVKTSPCCGREIVDRVHRADMPKASNIDLYCYMLFSVVGQTAKRARNARYMYLR